MKGLFLSYGVLKDEKLKEKILYNLFEELRYNELFIEHLKNNVCLGTVSSIIHSMNKAKVIGPVFIDNQFINLPPAALKHKENKFNKLKNGKIKKYFRKNTFTD